MSPIKNLLRSTIRKAGFEPVRTHSLPPARRAQMMSYNGIQTVLDVGANRGDYAGELRENGFTGKILSFEPTSIAYKQLAQRAANDPAWETFRCAVGAEAGSLEINVASHTAGSSSLLPMTEAHKLNAPDIQYIGRERVDVVTLDDALRGKLQPNEAVLLKIDTQGFEEHVLAGAASVLPWVRLLECEFSLAELYQGQPAFMQMLALLDSLGFEPVQFLPGFTAADSGYCLQIDGIFARKQAASAP